MESVNKFRDEIPPNRLECIDLCCHKHFTALHHPGPFSNNPDTSEKHAACGLCGLPYTRPTGVCSALNTQTCSSSQETQQTSVRASVSTSHSRKLVTTKHFFSCNETSDMFEEISESAEETLRKDLNFSGLSFRLRF